MTQEKSNPDQSLNRRNFIKTSAIVSSGLLLSGSSVFAGNPTKQESIVQTKYGKVRGSFSGGIHTFKGIRYGADTSNRRFQPPLPPDNWNGIADATEYGANAPQGNGENTSEDCLFLNVWTPALDDAKKRPVLFYIHGGAFSNGSGSDPLTDGTNLCQKGDVVVVSINHRLNAFGYLYLGMMGDEKYASSGNVGQLDIILALKWVQDHAEAFGGDPGNVTVFGQSGGGAKIATLMAMPSAKGLFHRAWTMSGQQVVAAGPRAATQRAGLLLETLGLKPNELENLQNAPMNDILAATKVRDFSRVENKSLHFCPVLDHTALPCHPFYPVAATQSAEIPMVIGNTKDETRAFLGRIPGVHELSWEQLPQLILENQFVDIRPDVVIEGYRKMYPEYTATEVFFAATTAGRSWRGAVIEAEERSKQNGAATWVYQLNWQSPVNGGKLGACHAMDIPLVFNNTAVEVSPSGNGQSAQNMANVMSETLLAFARTGNPGHNKLTAWPPFSLPTRETMLFDEVSRMDNDPRGGERKLYGQVPFLQRGTY
ncbi:carboxylesterase/lipase family protein [Mangrovibacterium lignilyticum]|uniref:carboxylesterase/lipase family protein n=1 Tax=Mangrovibacterium lignilyticum TaxID=2668052 RepID=UPI0013D31975|nr:carboxylesterase/lipase family protein [Mangrovibacterium lignilyticum]